MKNYSLADKLHFINESENKIDYEAFSSMVRLFQDCITICQNGDSLKRVIQKQPDRASDVMNMLGIALLIAADPEYINRNIKNIKVLNLQRLGRMGWEQISREFRQGTDDLDENGVKLLKAIFIHAKLLD